MLTQNEIRQAGKLAVEVEKEKAKSFEPYKKWEEKVDESSRAKEALDVETEK